MADWKDFFEDNKESLGQYLDSLAEKKRSSDGRHTPSAPLQFCPICHAAYISSIDLDSHIMRVHGPQHVYLRVNGRIVRDIGWAEQGVSELRVVLLGFPNAAIRIEGAGLSRSTTSSGEDDFRDLIPKGFEGEIRLEVSPTGGKSRQFTLFSRSLPAFRREDLDELILSWTRKPATDGDAPDIGRWREVVGNIGALENRYLNGFFEYSLAFHLSNQRHTDRAKSHFEEAFGLLLPFRTPLAHSAQCVLGLSMNCFGVLGRASSRSLVSASNVFFNQPYGSNWTGAVHSDNGAAFLTYADEFTIRLVRVIADFYGDDHSLFGRGLAALEFHPLAMERNNHDKLLLLRARHHRTSGEKQKEQAAYEMLRFHPFFGAEAEESLNA